MKSLRRTIISKHGLILAAKGETELASQIFVYDLMREIRMDITKLEVKILMTYDEAFYRVFSVKPKDDTEEAKKEAEMVVAKFYNDLLNASMKLTPEEIENIRKQNLENEKKFKKGKE